MWLLSQKAYRNKSKCEIVILFKWDIIYKLFHTMSKIYSKKKETTKWKAHFINIHQIKWVYFQNNATLLKFIALLNYLSYEIKGNKVKLYIYSYNVYALGFCCNIPSVNGNFFLTWGCWALFVLGVGFNYRILFWKMR